MAYTDQFASVTPADIERLITLYSKNEEFLNYIANDAQDPFRTTSYIRHVTILDDIFRGKLADKDVAEICLSDFEVEGERGILNQLPNLLKTYILKSDYEFGNNRESDKNFCYMVYRIIRAGHTFTTYKNFETAFLKAQALGYLYKRLERGFIARDENQGIVEVEETDEEDEV